MTNTRKPRQALTGVRVIDLTRVLCGPYCSMMLADQGAEVIKIEIPACGDDARHIGPPFVAGESAFFVSINRNKKSITLNLKSPEGLQILQGLVRKSDVVLENYRPGVAKRLGVDYDALKKLNSRLIYCSISGYGQTGPYHNQPAYNFTVQGMSGVMTMTGEPGTAPSPVGISLGDIPAGMFSAFAITSALYAREITGRGQCIDISMLDSLLAMMENPIVRHGVTGQCPQPIGRYNPSITPFGVFDTQDTPIVIAAGNDRLWKTLCEIMELGHPLTDPRFVTNALRTENRDDLHRVLEETLIKKKAHVWLRLFAQHGIPVAPVNRVDQVFDDPQVRAREMLVEVMQPLAGKMTVVGTPVKVIGDSQAEFRPAPQLGEHTDEVLTNLLGLSLANVASLRQKGAL